MIGVLELSMRVFLSNSPRKVSFELNFDPYRHLVTFKDIKNVREALPRNDHEMGK